MKKILSIFKILVGSWVHPVKNWKWVLSELVVIAAVVFGLNIVGDKKPAVPAAAVADTTKAVVDTTKAVVDTATAVKPAVVVEKK